MGTKNSPRFRPVYVYPSGKRRYSKPPQGSTAKRSKGVFFDTKNKTVISERAYTKARYGVTKEQRAARPKGYPTPYEIHTKKLGYQSNYLAARYGEKRGFSATSAKKSKSFRNLELELATFSKRREELIREGKRNTKAYRDLTRPRGRYAQVLVDLGLRDANSRRYVGNSPPKKGR